MNRFLGEEKLKKQAEIGFPKGVTKITDGVYFALGYGGSTCTLVEGENECILVDTLNAAVPAEEALAEFRKYTDKPIKHIIYTHYFHFDHTSGAGVFATEGCPIIGYKTPYPQYGGTDLLKNAYMMRGGKQFGLALNAEESICIGIGPRNDNNREKKPLKPNQFFTEKQVTMNLGGVEVVLTAAPGETDDQLFVWFPKQKVLCCGDNYYESWPNLYAIRGGQYRDVYSWVQALENMLKLDAEYLLPGHTRAVVGKDVVKETLTNYHDAIEYVLVETLKGMEQGMTTDQLAETVVLPEKWAKLPYLQEYYGTVAWTVRSIYGGYLGWFDGNPTNLGAMKIKDKAEHTIRMMGGADAVLAEIRRGLAEEDEQWAVELCDVLINAGQLKEDAVTCKAAGLLTLGRMQTSANARHYYIATANQLLGKGKAVGLNGAAADAEKKSE